MNIDRKLNQVGTWWSTTPNGYGGDNFGTPTKISMRWEDLQEVIPAAEGTKEKISNAVVFVDRDISVGDYLCQGDHTIDSDPTLVDGALKVQHYGKVTDLRNVQSLRRAML